MIRRLNVVEGEMSRLSVKKPEDMSAEELEQFSSVAQNWPLRESGEFGGPFDAWLRSPEVSRLAMSFVDFAWERTALGRRLVEVAILVTGRHWESNVEWVAHSRMARQNGVSDEVIAAVFERRLPEEPEDERLVVEIARALHETHRLPEETYSRAVSAFGERGLMDLVAVLGLYDMVAMTLAAFDVQPGGADRPFAV
jgi:4-carboxymuconolactone decarboxylase